jgi:proteasome lid subunit RPN8/RPN11
MAWSPGAEGEAVLSAALARLAEGSPAAEVCGLVVASPVGELAAWPAANVASDPRAAFELAPEDVLAALTRLDRGGGRLVGLYHSHLAGGAHLSAADEEAAALGGGPGGEVVMVVVALTGGRARVVRWHRRTAEGWVHWDPWRRDAC